MHSPLKVFIISTLLSVAAAALDPDMSLTFPELIESRGFTLISYTVVTADSYILTLHRVVPRDFNETAYTQTRKPVIVQHGLMSSSADFFTNSPFLEPSNSSATCGDNFGFCLVMSGRYDIWLPNSRGTDFSTGHEYLSYLLPAYWRFAWDQMATEDLPAVISFVQATTGHQKIGWVGHSQGTTTMFALLSMQPQYANIIQPFIAWAPPVFIGNMTSPLKDLTFIEPALIAAPAKFIETTEIYAFLQQWGCVPVPSLCESSITGILGPSNSLNVSRIPVYDHFYPSGASDWTVAQFMQMITSNEFNRFDYCNSWDNLQAYPETNGAVPELNLLNIPANYTIALMYGATDALVDSSGVTRLKDVLQQANVNVIDYKVPKDQWNHVDFVWGMGAGGLVYDKTIQILDQYSQ